MFIYKNKYIFFFFFLIKTTQNCTQNKLFFVAWIHHSRFISALLHTYFPPLFRNIFSSNPLNWIASRTPTSRIDFEGSFRPSLQSRNRIYNKEMTTYHHASVHIGYARTKLLMRKGFYRFYATLLMKPFKHNSTSM